MNDIQVLLQSPVTLALLLANIGLSVIALSNAGVMDRSRMFCRSSLSCCPIS